MYRYMTYCLAWDHFFLFMYTYTFKTRFWSLCSQEEISNISLNLEQAKFLSEKISHRSNLEPKLLWNKQNGWSLLWSFIFKFVFLRKNVNSDAPPWDINLRHWLFFHDFYFLEFPYFLYRSRLNFEKKFLSAH